MAARFSPLVLVATLSLLHSLSAVDARPCRAFIVSTYSFSVLPQNPHPNLIAVVAEVRPAFFPPHDHHHHRLFMNRPGFATIERPEEEFQRPRPRLPPFEEEFSSFRDRTKDILSVVASLLFGAACGALTAGTMYLVWSLFNHRNQESYRALDGLSSDDDEDDDIFNPKKKGYAVIPATPEADPAPAAAPAKE